MDVYDQKMTRGEALVYEQENFGSDLALHGVLGVIFYTLPYFVHYVRMFGQA